MSDMGVYNQNAIERIQFFKRSEQIQLYLRDLIRYAINEEKEVLNRASEVISNIVERVLNQYEEKYKDILSMK
jgi:ribose 1,5-bisphosphokinase PhnN